MPGKPDTITPSNQTCIDKRLPWIFDITFFPERTQRKCSLLCWETLPLCQPESLWKRPFVNHKAFLGVFTFFAGFVWQCICGILIYSTGRMKQKNPQSARIFFLSPNTFVIILLTQLHYAHCNAATCVLKENKFCHARCLGLKYVCFAFMQKKGCEVRSIFSSSSH